MADALNPLRRYSSLGFAAATLLVFLAGIWLLPAGGASGDGAFVAEFNRLYGYVGSDDQRKAHVLAVLAIAILSALSFFLGRRGDAADLRLRAVPRLGIETCLLLAIACLGALWKVALAPVVIGAGALCLLFLLLVLSGPWLRGIPHGRIAAVLVGAYLLLLVVPGFLVNPIAFLVSDADSISQLETHLQWLPLRGSAVAAGQMFFREIPLGYGLLMPSILSVADLRTGGLSVAELLRFVQASQVLFSVAAVAAYVAYRPRNDLGILAAMLLAGAYWATAGLGIWHANQTGFRSLGLPAGMLALMLAGRLPPARAAGWLGAVAAVVFLSNLETSVAVIGGFAVFLVMRTRSIPMRLFVRMALAGALAILAYLAAYRLALGRNAFALDSLDVLSLFGRASGGGWGSRLFVAGPDREGYYLVPFALFMFAHAAYVVIEGFRRLGAGALPARSAQRVAVAVTLIAWLAYYFNSPNWWQIWTHLFLYGFLVIDLVDRRRFGIGAPARASLGIRLGHMRVAPGVFMLLLFLAFMIPHTNRHLLKYGAEFVRPSWIKGNHDTVLLSGVLLPKDKAELLERKARRLEALHAEAKGALVYLSFNSAFMPLLTRLFQPAPYRDMFGEIQGESAFGPAIAELLLRQPAAILIDAPEGALAVSGPRKDYQDRIRAAISSGYRIAGTEDGWQVWRPKN